MRPRPSDELKEEREVESVFVQNTEALRPYM